MIYELRIYHAMPGKLQELHERFEYLVTALLEKHGINALGFWTDYVGPSNHTITWLVQFSDVQDREFKWQNFKDDPVWIDGRDRSEADGPILSHWENRLLTPTDYSKLR